MDYDQSRLAATSNDDFTLTIEEVVVRYEHAGHPRTVRSIQRYCARGDLDCLRQETTFGEKYLITPASVARHLAQIAEVTAATGRDMTRFVAASISSVFGGDSQRQVTTETSDTQRPATTMSPPVAPLIPTPVQTTSSDLSRQDAAQSDFHDRYVKQLEGEIGFLREEINTKNSQIQEMTERSRETNLLIGGLQRMLSPLLGNGEGQRSHTDGFNAPNH